jgi:hypothetical protein
MLNVVFSYCYAECHNAECRYAECHYAQCRYAECRYAECRYAECRYAECRGAEMELCSDHFLAQQGFQLGSYCLTKKKSKISL